MNLGDMRAYVRAHTDLDETDIPDSLVDIWLGEGYRRVQEYVAQWPHLLAEQTYEVEDGELDVSEWRLIQDVRIDRWSLREIPHRTARERWPDTTATAGTPSHYSLFGDVMYLWPLMSPQTVKVRGVLEAGQWPTTTTEYESVEQVVGESVAWPAIETYTANDIDWPVTPNVTTSESAPEEPEAGDYWLAPTSLSVYESAEWVAVTPLTGTTPPDGTVGDDGDLYVDSSAGVVYGPRVGDALASIDVVNGALLLTNDGGEYTLYLGVSDAWVEQALLVGGGTPTASVGVDGTYFLDEAIGELFGPRATTPVTETVQVATYESTTATDVPPMLPARMHYFLPRWAISQAYLRESDQETAGAIRAQWVEELDVYKQREVFLTGSESFTISDGGSNTRMPSRLRYSWE